MKNSKILIFFILIVLLLTLIPTKISATYGPQQKFQNPDFSKWKPDSPGNYNKVKEIGGEITGFIQVIGSVFSLAALVIIGIKYMLGSAEEKADYKKTMIPYLVGCFLVFACTALPSIIYNMANGF